MIAEIVSPTFFFLASEQLSAGLFLFHVNTPLSDYNTLDNIVRCSSTHQLEDPEKTFDGDPQHWGSSPNRDEYDEKEPPSRSKTGHESLELATQSFCHTSWGGDSALIGLGVTKLNAHVCVKRERYKYYIKLRRLKTSLVFILYDKKCYAGWSQERLNLVLLLKMLLFGVYKFIFCLHVLIGKHHNITTFHI
ncbi:hypothetical protein ACJX0J_015588 [Zea mays]